jgi:hypothetical protein
MSNSLEDVTQTYRQQWEIIVDKGIGLGLKNMKIYDQECRTML